MAFTLPRPMPGVGLKRFDCFNFSGGLDLKTAPTVLARRGEHNKWLLLATNVVYNTDGSVSKRWGQRSISESLTLDNTSVLGATQYKKAAGTIIDVIVLGDGNAYSVATNGVLTSLTTGLSATSLCSFETYNDTLFMANGTNTPKQYDGTTWADLGGSSPATANVFVAHGSRLFATSTNTSRLFWSKINNPLDWSGTTDAGFLDVQANDGAILNNIVSGMQELVLLKDSRPYRLQGIGPTTGYSIADNLVPATGSVGAPRLWYRAAAFAANQVWWASRIGVHSQQATSAYGDLDETFPSARIEPYFRTNTSVSLDFTANTTRDKPFVVYNPQHNALYVTGTSSSGVSFQDRILVYDLGLQAWSVWQTTNANTRFPYIWRADNRTTGEHEVWTGDFYSGPNDTRLRAFDRSTTSDLDINGAAVAISATVRHVSNLSEPHLTKKARRLYLYFRKESATTTMTLNLYLDFNTTAAFTTTFDITSSTAETLVIKRIDLPSGLRCEFLEVELVQATAGKSFTFYGYECQWQPDRLIRRAE